MGLIFLLSYLFVPHKKALASGIFLKPLLAPAVLPSKDQGVCEGREGAVGCGEGARRGGGSARGSLFLDFHPPDGQDADSQAKP